MKYNFDEIIDRTDYHSEKWDELKGKFGDIPEDVLPMWVADMEFRAPKPVIEANKKDCRTRYLRLYLKTGFLLPGNN